MANSNNGYASLGGKPMTKTRTLKQVQVDRTRTKAEKTGPASSGGSLPSFGTPGLTGTSMSKPQTAGGFTPLSGNGRTGRLGR